MDSDNDSYHFPKCQMHAYTRFENGCSENSTQKLFTKYSTEENNKHSNDSPCTRADFPTKKSSGFKDQKLHVIATLFINYFHQLEFICFLKKIRS